MRKFDWDERGLIRGTWVRPNDKPEKEYMVIGFSKFKKIVLLSGNIIVTMQDLFEDYESLQGKRLGMMEEDDYGKLF